MYVKVRCFASAREAVGAGELDLALPDNAAVADLRERLFDDYPALRTLGLQFAVNATYATPQTTLHEGDEVACIPPVGGG